MGVAESIFTAVLATFLYLVPAGSLHLLVGGLANPRIEGWDATPEALQWKSRYRHGAWWGRRINLLLFGFFLVQTLSLVILAANACDPHRSHLTGAADTIVLGTNIGFQVGFSALVLLAIAAIPWAGLYWSTARRAGWADPRKRDYFIVHLVFVPLALLLLYVAFGVVSSMLC